MLPHIRTLILFSMLCVSNTWASNQLIIQLSNLPATMMKQLEQDYEATRDPKKLTIAGTTPAATSKLMVQATIRRYLHPSLSGFEAFYAGQRIISDNDGCIKFGLHHSKPLVYLAITQDINLLKIKGNTIKQEEFSKEPTMRVSYYSFECKDDDENKSNKTAATTKFWRVTKLEKPTRDEINKLTVIILSNPDNFYIPVGDFIIPGSTEHLILPAIHVIGSTDNESSILQSLDIDNYFERLPPEKEQKSGDVLQRIQQYALFKFLKSPLNFFYSDRVKTKQVVLGNRVV